MLTVLSILGVLAVLFAAAAVATREGPILADAPADIADVVLPPGPLQPEDLNSVRFGLAIRGYRMDQVDRVLERAAAEIGERDARIAELLHAAAAKPTVEEPVAEEPDPEHTRSAPSVSPAAINPVGAVSEPLVPAMPHDSAEALDSFDEPAEPEPVVAAEPASVEPEEPTEPEPLAVAEPEAEEPVASLLADSEESGPVVPIEPPLDSPPPPPAEPDESPDELPVEPPTGPPVDVAVVPLETAPLPADVTLDEPPTGDEDNPPRD